MSVSGNFTVNGKVSEQTCDGAARCRRWGCPRVAGVLARRVPGRGERRASTAATHERRMARSRSRGSFQISSLECRILAAADPRSVSPITVLRHIPATISPVHRPPGVIQRIKQWNLLGAVTSMGQTNGIRRVWLLAAGF